MDTQQEFTPSTFGSPHKNKKLIIAVLLTGAISSAVSLVFMYWNPKSKEVPTLSALVVAYGSTPASILNILDSENHTPKPLTVKDSGGRELKVLDVLQMKDGNTFYILTLDTKDGISNLYERSTNGELIQLTKSNSLKYNLSYGAVSKTYFYMSAETKTGSSSKEWDITTFDPQEGKEEFLAKGENPIAIEEGRYVLFKKDNGLYSIDTHSRKVSVKIMDLPPNSLYAVDPTANKIALYNPTTLKIDFFNLIGGMFAGYSESKGAGESPIMISYVHGQLMTVYGVQRKDLSVLAFITQDGKINVHATLIGDIKELRPQRIYAYHE